MKTVLVTGGCGFIGSNFITLLGADTDWRIVNLDKLTYAGNLENVAEIVAECHRFVHDDICDRVLVERILQEERPWAVINFAAESHVDRSILDSSPFLQTNIGGLHALLEAVRKYPVNRFLHISTDEVCGDREAKESSTEETSLVPSSPYAASKAAADLMCISYRHTHGLPIIITRSSNNYGPRQFPETFIPLVIRNVLQGLEVPVYGDGKQIRDWLYVEDNCRAILAVLNDGYPGCTYNIGAGEERTNLDVVEAICAALSKETGMDRAKLNASIRLVTDRPGHDHREAIDVNKIRVDIAWSAGTAFEVGLKRTIRWYLEHHDWIRRVTSEEYLKYNDSVYAQAWGLPGKAQRADDSER